MGGGKGKGAAFGQREAVGRKRWRIVDVLKDDIAIARRCAARAIANAEGVAGGVFAVVVDKANFSGIELRLGEGAPNGNHRWATRR